MWTLLIAYVFQGIIFGVICSYVASTKGYNGGFAWGFFLGIIGLLVVGFRPNLTQASAEAPVNFPLQKPTFHPAAAPEGKGAFLHMAEAQRALQPCQQVRFLLLEFLIC